MLVIFDKSTNPYFNLASEEYLLKAGHFSEPVIRIWQNSPAVIIGMFQNTLAEINEDFIEKNKIAVVRRITGGGAVYHDLGNINYTIVQPSQSKKIDFVQFTKPILQLLAGYGLTAQSTGRNDLEIAGCKISGGAQTILKDRILHHGTLLFQSNLENMAQALQVKKSKLESKGVQSIRARVGNISDYLPKPLSVEDFLADLKSFFLQQSAGKEYQFSKAELAAIKKLSKEKYERWSWNYGFSPDYNLECSYKYSWGELNIYLLLKDERISKIKVFGDFFSTGEVQKEFTKFIGTNYTEKDLNKRLSQTNIFAVLPLLTKKELLRQLLKKKSQA